MSLIWPSLLPHSNILMTDFGTGWDSSTGERDKAQVDFQGSSIEPIRAHGLNEHLSSIIRKALLKCRPPPTAMSHESFDRERSGKRMEKGVKACLTSHVKVGWSRVTGPCTVCGNTFIFALIRLLTVLNLQGSYLEIRHRQHGLWYNPNKHTDYCFVPQLHLEHKNLRVSGNHVFLVGSTNQHLQQQQVIHLCCQKASVGPVFMAA